MGMGCSDLVRCFKHTLRCMPRQPAQHKVQGTVACLEKSGVGIRGHGCLQQAVCGRLALPGHLDRSRGGRGLLPPRSRPAAGPHRSHLSILSCAQVGAVPWEEKCAREGTGKLRALQVEGSAWVARFMRSKWSMCRSWYVNPWPLY